MAKKIAEDSNYVLLELNTVEYINTCTETRVPIEHVGYDIVPRSSIETILNRLSKAFHVIQDRDRRRGENNSDFNIVSYCHSEAHTFSYRELRDVLDHPIPITNTAKRFMIHNKLVGHFPSMMTILKALEENIADGEFDEKYD